MVKNNFNAVAFIYDTLARVVFGGAIVTAQTYYLRKIPKNARVLVVGGGTGWILNKMDQLERPMSVTYVEASSAMIKKAQKREPFKYLEVEFIHATHEVVWDMAPFDVIITNFFLDLFDRDNLQKAMQLLLGRLNDNGLWIFTDFVANKNWWQRALIRLMFWFFKITARLESHELLNFDEYFHTIGMQVKEQHFSYAKMIKSGVYIRS